MSDEQECVLSMLRGFQKGCAQAAAGDGRRHFSCSRRQPKQGEQRATRSPAVTASGLTRHTDCEAGQSLPPAGALEDCRLLGRGVQRDACRWVGRVGH